MFAFRLPVVLQGRNVFEENRGGGLAIIDSRLHSQGDLYFTRNVAEEGAGMTLVDQSLVLTHIVQSAAKLHVCTCIGI